MTLAALDTFNIQEKRYWFLGLNEQARKFGLKTIKNRQNERRNRKLFFIDPATARYGTTPVVAENQRKFNSILRYRVACSFCESFILRIANKTPVETCLRELIFSIVKT